MFQQDSFKLSPILAQVRQLVTVGYGEYVEGHLLQQIPSNKSSENKTQASSVHHTTNAGLQMLTIPYSPSRCTEMMRKISSWITGDSPCKIRLSKGRWLAWHLHGKMEYCSTVHHVGYQVQIGLDQVLSNAHSDRLFLTWQYQKPVRQAWFSQTIGMAAKSIGISKHTTRWYCTFSST